MTHPAPLAPLSESDPELARLSINDRLSLISLIDEGIRLGSSDSPKVADLFGNLWQLVGATVSGSKIDRLAPELTPKGFRVFEINADSGENLGRLNMIYLKKPIPCYYLVFVEVAPPFRRKGLGNRILEYFRGFLKEKSAVGILDNIIPEDDPTYDIYAKQAWEPIEDVIGEGLTDPEDNYMVFIPPCLRGKDIRGPLVKLIHHLKRKRAVIDMRDNEVMVGRTIAEFREVFGALRAYFGPEIDRGETSRLMCFMFTRFVTKLIAFRRRIGELIGYTGGDSLEQIILPGEIAVLPVQSYAPRELDSRPLSWFGEEDLWVRLPEDLKQRPARFIESLPDYQRPSLINWRRDRGGEPGRTMTLGDLMDLGFDPTRLKEIAVDGRDYIFERIQVRQVEELRRKKEILERLASEMPGARVKNARLGANQVRLVILDSGNAYVLRRKVEGIHWEEAVEQLQTTEELKKVNASTRIDRLILATVRKVNQTVARKLDLDEKMVQDQMTCFVSWDLAGNRPRLLIDYAGTSLDAVWMA
ncbi:MAG: hypothetical protein KKB20_26350 [Proteobacteria bacterium]|nr:hypothetical protein [Pseudomonadota bacterium]